MDNAGLTMNRLLITTVAGILIVFGMKLFRARNHFRKLQKQGLPMPPHHWLFGHLPLIAQVTKVLPPYAAGGYIATSVRQRYPDLRTAIYLDVWPFSRRLLVVMNPVMMYQLTQANQIPKDPGLRTFLAPLTGKEDLVTMEGQNWKRWRSIFNPGFSGNRINTLVPGMVEKVQVFRNMLAEKAASGELFLLEKLTLNLTIDIIGGPSCRDHDFHSQTKYNDMTTALRSQLQWCTMGIELNPLDHLKDLIRPVIYRYNTWRMNRYLNRVLETRYNSLMGKEYNPGKSVIDLALKAYLKENISAETIPAPFKAAALAQIKLFIFAGHDTTSSAVVFTFHLLSKHPQALKRMREEHNAVLGINERKALSVLMSNPHLLNQLPYTLAAIKEALRLYSTVAAIRDGQPDFSLVAQDGQIFPTEGCMVWGDHYANHHNPDIWPRAEEYLPERWLCKEGGPLYPPSNAWRPFERGPRNCIGQELTLTEIKIILALTIREFTIKDAYAEFDKAKRNVRNMTVNGTRAYMVRIGGGGHPADEYPCRVSMW